MLRLYKSADLNRRSDVQFIQRRRFSEILSRYDWECPENYIQGSLNEKALDCQSRDAGLNPAAETESELM